MAPALDCCCISWWQHVLIANHLHALAGDARAVLDALQDALARSLRRLAAVGAARRLRSSTAAADRLPRRVACRCGPIAGRLPSRLRLVTSRAPSRDRLAAGSLSRVASLLASGLRLAGGSACRLADLASGLVTAGSQRLGATVGRIGGCVSGVLRLVGRCVGDVLRCLARLLARRLCLREAGDQC